MAIYWEENDLWWAQEQGFNGRTIIGGYLTRKALFKACVAAFGEDVRMEAREEEEEEDEF